MKNLQEEGGTPAEATTETTPAEGSEQGIQPRENNDIQPCVAAAATTITRCTEHEVKNFCATADYIARQVAVWMADNWTEICKTSQKASDGGDKAAKVAISGNFVLDQTNMLFHSTKITLAFSQKHKGVMEIEEDLKQVQFDLGAV